jgi:very-short-patch-repair endonuclease
MENCKFCDKTYLGRNASLNLKKHLIHCIYNPDSIRYKCERCEREFEKRHALCAHKKFCGKLIESKKTIKPNKTICNFCGYIAKNGLSLGGHISNCLSNPNYKKRVEKLKVIGVGRKHSEETKKKISDARKKYLSENPDKVPYKLNHSSKESYPEKYFTEVFKNEGINVVKSFYIGLYELDFSIPNKKIDIEIDGSQHYYDEKIIESDKRRNKFLEDNGWDIIRINWSEYKKLNFDEKSEYISNLKKYINNIIDTKPFFEIDIKENRTKERKHRSKSVRSKKLKKRIPL